MNINEIECKSIINRTRIPGLDYCINPYVGCAHGCVYCYARFMSKYTKHKASWGDFVDVKINAPDILKKQITRLSGGKVSLSTVTDPYQYLEKKYELTRRILVHLKDNDFNVSILTKSDLVLRDIDILKQFKKSRCEVGFSMMTLDDNIRRSFEPLAPSIKKRIGALKELHNNGIQTWLFVAPVLPHITKQTIYELLDTVKDSIDYVLLDKLNIKCGNWKTISCTLSDKYPKLLSQWDNLLKDKKKREIYYKTFNSFTNKIGDFCRQKNIKIRYT